MVRLESIAIAVLGAVLGVVIGIAFGVALVKALSDQGLDVLAVPWVQLVIFVLMAVVIGVLAAWLPARRAARLNVLGTPITHRRNRHPLRPPPVDEDFEGASTR